MKRLLNILVFCCLNFAAVGQEDTRAIDSLQNVLRHQEGRAKVETMIELSMAFFDYSFDDCVDWGEKAIEEAVRLHDEELMAKAYWKMGLRYLNHYEFDLAHEQFVTALKMLEGQKDSELLVDVLNYKGYVELFMGEIDSALATLQRNLQVSEGFGDESNCADLINNMAYIHFQQDNIDMAMECFRDARLRYAKVHDTLSMAQCDNNISNIYVQWQRFDEALALLEQAIPVFEQNGDEASLAHAYQNMGTIYATGFVNLDSALVYLRKSIVCAEKVGDQITLVEDEIELANVMKQLNNKAEAVSLYQSALHSSETMGFMNGLLGAYKSLGIYYNEAGDFTTSAIYLKRCVDLATEKGNQLYVNSVRPYLIADYAHLGRFAEMSMELGLFQTQYENSINESNILVENLARLKENAESLSHQYETQNKQIETFKTQRNHYRLAFFGLLALVFISVVVLLAYKNVRKNRVKTKKG